ncbi:MAG TPA: CGNR zinc finger domain-containing protein [Solirubrobacteraceae bacterium]
MIPGRSYDRVDAATPPALRQVQAFLNTLDEREFERLGERHRHEDLLASPRQLRAWFDAARLDDARVDARTYEYALELRGALRAVLAARAGLPADLEAANATLARYPLLLRASPSATRLAAVPPDAHPALAELASAFAAGAVDGSLHRMRMCAAADCRWVFYDGSRSGQGRWCSMEPCGNRAKTRAYRRRRSGAAARHRAHEA